MPVGGGQHGTSKGAQHQHNNTYAAIVPHLPAFMDFCVTKLLKDVNFKISLTTLQVTSITPRPTLG